jgi:hypothetical protein
MEDGFKDACYALCEGERPVPRISQACRAAAIELPRPVVRKWCEHGYKQGYHATVDSLYSYFNPTDKVDSTVQGQIESTEPEVEEKIEIYRQPTPTEPPKPIVRTIPVTIDEEVKDLNIYEGQSVEEAVASFCESSMPEDVSGCIRQLLTLVLDQM